MTQVMCPIVIGRDRELSLLRERVRQAAGGGGGVLFLVGEAGIGKSRLSREAEAMARERSMRALRGRAVQASVPVPFRPLAEALQGVRPPDAAGLAPYRRALGRLVPEWAEEDAVAGAEAPPLLVLEGTLHLLRSLAGGDGALIVLEDVHWADEDTLACIEYLADHLDSERLLVLGTARSDEVGAGARLPQTLSARRAATTIALTRLSPKQSSEMVRASLEDGDVPDHVVRAVGNRAEGVPFLVEELLSAYVRSGPEAERSDAWIRTLPPSYRDLVRERLADLPADARGVVQAGAILGRTFDWSILGGVTGLDDAAVLDALRRGVNARLIEGAGGGSQVTFGFRHALARDAVREELLPPEAADLALRSAAVIEERFPGLPGEWCELAAGLREEGGDRLGAARDLLEAGRRALARAALGSAESNLERARTLAREDPWLVLGIGRVLVQTLAQSGKVERIRRVAGDLMEFFERSSVGELWSHLMAPVHLQIARGLVTGGGDSAVAQEHLERARTLAKPADEVLLARIDAFAGQVALVGGDLAGAEEVASRALRGAERLRIPDVRCESLEVLGRVQFLHGDAEEAIVSLRNAAAGAEDHGLGTWRARALSALGTVERCTTGELGTLRESLSAAEAAEAIATQTRIQVEIGRGYLERFDREASIATLQAGVSLARRYRLPLLPDALVDLAHAMAILGRRAEAETVLQEASRRPVAAYVSAVLALVAGERARAEDELDRAALEVGSDIDPRPWPGLWALLGALGGRHDRAARVAGSAHAAHRAAGGYLAFAEAVRLGSNGDADGAAVQFESADRAMGPFPWDRHVGRLHAAEGAARDGWGTPAAWMAETLGFFDEAGHRGLADASKRILRGVGAPVPRKGRGDSPVPQDLRVLGVTSREMDVLRLVAEGLSNPEIAERLHLSRRTVESHVASLLRRTGSATRGELAERDHPPA